MPVPPPLINGDNASQYNMVILLQSIDAHLANMELYLQDIDAATASSNAFLNDISGWTQNLATVPLPVTVV